MQNDLLYRIALTLVPHIGAVQARILIQHFGDAAAVFKAKKSMLGKLQGIGEIRAGSILHFNRWEEAEKEIAFIARYKITPLFISDAQYPTRLLNCYDPPTLLYYRGSAPLNAPRVIAVVGTRYKTEYGKQLAETLLRELAAQEGLVVVSGLALGIDAIAHKTALKNNIPTIGVLAHGLDKIYPTEHTALAKDMLQHGGGLLTEFGSKTAPDKHNFPRRNRIVAGMTDATIVIETDTKGGSMITANLANGYHREVFAFPGKTSDARSAGCNQLIRDNKATLITCAQDLSESMGWLPQRPAPVKLQQELPGILTDEEKKMVQLLQEKQILHVDELTVQSGLSAGQAATVLLSLEMQQILYSLPGKRYKLQ